MGDEKDDLWCSDINVPSGPRCAGMRRSSLKDGSNHQSSPVFTGMRRPPSKVGPNMSPVLPLLYSPVKGWKYYNTRT